MDVITDISNGKNEINECIKRYGSVGEHNFWFFNNQVTSYAKPFFFKFDKDFGIMSLRYKSGLWEILGEVLAPEEKRIELFNQFLEYVLITRKDKKVFVFPADKFTNSIMGMLKHSTKYRLSDSPIVYYTPVFDMRTWDETLQGKKWKKLRYIKNKLTKSHDIEIVPSEEVDKKKLIDIVFEWKKKRPMGTKAYFIQMYANFVKNDFEGTEIARIILVNGEPCSITAGWPVPNSNTTYHSAIGLHNYKCKGIGELANIDDLNEIKKKRYGYADFGESAKSLLQFKKKFRPHNIYKSYWFHIVKK
ncbi:DUF2156 domain-containing protein [Candidatus Woesearchaeota archaeon]|nr:DUF2156 domain-containing protein [Candidatus Woesearchaeota archaeon]